MDMKLRRVPIYRFNMVTMLTVTLVSLEFNSKLSQHNLATLSEFRVVSVVFLHYGFKKDVFSRHIF